MADDQDPLSCREVIQSLSRLSSANAIDVIRTVDLGGIPQVVSIKGKDHRNPVLLFVHGGPGTPLAPTAWMWQRPIEDFFTVVHYDQRGAGRSYRLTDTAKICSAMGIDQYVSDAVKLTQWLRSQLRVDQVVLAGHSWGTVIATKAVLQRPDLFSAYLGVGQVVNFQAAEEASFTWLCDEAQQRGDEDAIQELQSLVPYPGPGPLSLDKLFTQRQWVRKFGGFAAGRSDCDYFTFGEVTAMDYQGEELISTENGNLLSSAMVMPQLREVDFTDLTHFPVPMLQFLGRHDWMTPASLVPPWLERMEAPRKGIEWFEDSAHMAMYEEPGHFLTALLRHLDVVPAHA